MERGPDHAAERPEVSAGRLVGGGAGRLLRRQDTARGAGGRPICVTAVTTIAVSGGAPGRALPFHIVIRRSSAPIADGGLAYVHWPQTARHPDPSCATNSAATLPAEFFLRFFLVIPVGLRCDQTGSTTPQVALFCDREGGGNGFLAVPRQLWQLRDRTTIQGVAMSAIVSTSRMSPSDRVGFWHDAVSRTFVPLDVTLHEEVPSAATISSRQLGSMQVSTVTAGPQTVVRSPRVIAKDGKEYLTLTLLHQGIAERSQDGREAVVHPGQFSLSDSRRPFTKTLRQAFSFTSFHFPRPVLGVTDDDLCAVTATAFGHDDVSSALLAGHLERLNKAAESLTPAQGRRLALITCDLLACLIQERQGRLNPETPAAARALLTHIKEYVLRHLEHPDLTPANIASAHHVSVRYLHKLFEFEGITVGRWIQQQRLERCRRDLARATPHPPSVAAVAHRWGFVSPSHFSRVFRLAYGITPRDWQATARMGTTTDEQFPPDRVPLLGPARGDGTDGDCRVRHVSRTGPDQDQAGRRTSDSPRTQSSYGRSDPPSSPR
ncbi:helix-turn-helix domain-containing protein [Streptomyces sp. NPDC046984]|uniref:AraC-like ligand-binding domain-containing protein n=1 Tax=Streptomyces sp. NPDC046984 TaxID=3155138 RepID=UPI0033ECDF36